MQVRETNLKQLVHGEKQFRVPLWQRQYTWRIADHRLLWRDVMEQYTRATDDKAPASRPPYPGAVLGPAETWMPGPLCLVSAARVTATLAFMGAREHRRADHAPYIAAVRRGIETCGIRVAEVQVTVSGDGRREARLTLRPDDSAFAERVPAEASASWDEDNGWSLLARQGPLASCVHKGPGVAPDPEDVAAWAVVLLTHPELTPSREDHPFRDHLAADPGFEARLARYAPGA